MCLTFNQLGLSQFIKGGLYAGLLAPLIILSKQIYPFVFPRAVFFQILVEVLILLVILGSLFCKNFIDMVNIRRIKKSPFIWAFFGYIFVIFISAVFGANFSQSIYSTMERMDGFFFLSHVFLYVLMLIIFFEAKDWQRYWAIFGLVSMIIISISLIFPGEIDQRFAGIFGNPIALGSFLLFSIFMLFWLGWQRFIPKLAKMFLGLCLAAGLILLALTGSRGPFFACICGLAYAFISFFMLAKQKNRRKKAFLAGALIITCGLAFFLAMAKFSDEAEVARVLRLNPLNPKHLDQQRLLAWKAGFSAWQNRPLLGWGEDNFEIAFNKHFNPAILEHSSGWMDKPHNKYLEVLVETGLAGFLAYLAVIGTIIFSLTKIKAKTISFCFLGGLILAYLVENFFAFDNPLKYILFFSLAAFLSFLSQKKPSLSKLSDEPKPEPKLALKIFLLLASGLIFFSLYNFNIKPLRASALFRAGVREQTRVEARSEIIMKHYQKAFQETSFFKGELVVLAARNIVNATLEGDNRFLTGDALMELQAELEKTLKKDKLNIKAYLVLARLYQVIGVSKEDEQYFRRAKDVLQKAEEIYPERVEFQNEIEKINQFLNKTNQSSD